MSNPAPGTLELVRAFANTWDAEDQTDAIETPARLRDWLVARELLAADARVGAADLKRAHALRGALIAQLRVHHGGVEPEPSAAAELEAAARRAELSVRFGADGESVASAPLAGGVDGALGHVLVAVAEAMQAGTWIRLKICPADDCAVAFYDTSRNRSAVWCDMKVCGNRAKVRSFRERTAR